MKINTNKEKIQILLTRAVSGVLKKEHLEKRLNSGKMLRIKFGIDPTAPDIHLGHSVPLLKLRQFQELGHKAVLIIGDFTAQIGDPAGRTEARKPLSAAEVRKNMGNYLKQAGKILDIKKTEVQFNSKWFRKMKAADFYELAGKVTVQQVLKREDFKKRLKNDQDIAATEMMYPLFQGYDSVIVKADVEIGGEDQLVNLLMGRRIQRAYDMPEQDILTTWLIEGTDGVRKMSKSYGNYIGINEKPNIMFGKVMSIPDSLIIEYFRALTLVPDTEIDKFESDMKSNKTNPRDIKRNLAFEIVKMYHGEKKVKEAEVESKRKKQEKSAFTTTTEALTLYVTDKAPSKSQARRLISENAVKIDGKVVNNPNKKIKISSGMTIQVGKRRFVKIK